MKKLRDIIEAERSPERAEKLLNYIVKRKKIKLNKKKEISPFIDSAGAFNASKYVPTRQQWKNSLLINVPISKIKSSQSSVELDSLIKKIKGDKLNSPEFPEIIHHKETDTYHLIDGNHRVNAAKLLKKEFIKSRVISV